MDVLNDYFRESSLFDNFKPLMLPPNIFDVPSFLPQANFGQLFTDRELHVLRLEECSNEINQLIHDVFCHNKHLVAKAVALETEKNGKVAGAERVKALEGALDEVKGERDAIAKEEEQGQKAVEELKQQIDIKQKALQESHVLCSKRSDQLNRFEEEMHTIHLRSLCSLRS